MSTIAADTLRPGFRRVRLRSILEDAGGSSFDAWTGGRAAAVSSTNAGADALPFQRWHRFKEAFSPELIAEAVRSSPIPVRRLADPFGGSGTSALAAQFLGVEPVTIEVNPFLADLIAAKLAGYSTAALLTGLNRVARTAANARTRGAAAMRALPDTFAEPGVKGRWLFDRLVAMEIIRLRGAIEAERDPAIRRLFKVLLGGLIVSFSNAIVSGKGRRYRVNWQERRVDSKCVIPTFASAVAAAIVEITACASRPMRSSMVICGDSRALLAQVGPVDQIVCSPPYPNSFDYTDVYNMELWMLGYLDSSVANTRLRRATLSSHVQVSRNFAPPPKSPTLQRALRALQEVSDQLWDRRIPAMVGAYFADLEGLLATGAQLLPPGGQFWMVVGDSQYADVHVQVARILTELGPAAGLKVERISPFRSMRVSPQQSGRPMLSEDLVVFSRP